MKGFATKEILLDEHGKIVAVHAQATNYQQNLVTAHILEWELFKRYKKNAEITDDILSELKLRSAYHGGQPPLQAVLKPCDAFPLISVQALVIYKDYKDPNSVMWKAIIAQRGENVAIKPELWQIQPAAASKCMDTRMMILTYSSGKALMFVPRYSESMRKNYITSRSSVFGVMEEIPAAFWRNPIFHSSSHL